MPKILFFLILSYSVPGFSTVCLNSNRNCVGISAERMYLYTTPVCVMTAECDQYCGEMFVGRRPAKFYCGFRASNVCMSAQECQDNESVVRSREDITKLTYNPRSPGPGLVIPKDGDKK